MVPIIGVTASPKEQDLCVSIDYINAITKFGGIPLIIPYLREDLIDAVALRIDGLLLTGGGDIDPTLFGEEPIPGLGNIMPDRDAFEISLVKKMLELNKPILGICRGIQILNIAIGGDMYQDIYSQSDNTPLQHNQLAPRSHASHFVQVKEGTRLSEIVWTETLKVNSFHHQAVRTVPNPFQVCAIASDGTIEAIESKSHSFAIGLQWHPEGLLQKNDLASTAILETFIRACEK